MKLYIGFFYVIFELFFNGQSQIISKAYLLTNNSLLSTTRDGFLILTLNTGENTSVCNYRFTELNANVACKTLGYAAQGVSLVNPNSFTGGDVLIGDIKCVGDESNINLCIHSGRKVFGAPCSSHKSDVYLYCLQGKEAPVIPVNLAKTTCNGTNSLFTFVPALNKTNTGYILHNNNYLCNDDYSMTIPAAVTLCKKFCDSVVNPLPVVTYESGRNATHKINATSFVVTPIVAPRECRPGNALALQCGEEPQIIEPSPNITCVNQTIIATWIKGMVPPINPSLLTSPMPCTPSINFINNTAFDAIVTYNFNLCPAIITSNDDYITYSYRLTRAYQDIGITSTAKRNLTISCTLPKSDTANNNLTFNTLSPSQLNGQAVIPTSMTFYTDSSFQALMPAPYQIFDNQLLYVKVQLESTVNTLKLGLVNCKVSTESTMESTNSNNSVLLISGSCRTDSLVNFFPLNIKENGFSFKPSVINGITQIYVLCETTKCYVDPYDSACLYCIRSGKRRKRSPLNIDVVVHGPIYVFN